MPSAAAPHSTGSICKTEGVFTRRCRTARGIASEASELTNASDHVVDGMVRAHDELWIGGQPRRKRPGRALSSRPRQPAGGVRGGQSDDDLLDGTKTTGYIAERGVGSKGLHSCGVHRVLAHRGDYTLGVAVGGGCPPEGHLCSNSPVKHGRLQIGYVAVDHEGPPGRLDHTNRLASILIGTGEVKHVDHHSVQRRQDTVCGRRAWSALSYRDGHCGESLACRHPVPYRQGRERCDGSRRRRACRVESSDGEVDT